MPVNTALLALVCTTCPPALSSVKVAVPSERLPPAAGITMAEKMTFSSAVEKVRVCPDVVRIVVVPAFITTSALPALAVLPLKVGFVAAGT